MTQLEPPTIIFGTPVEADSEVAIIDGEGWLTLHPKTDGEENFDTRMWAWSQATGRLIKLQ
jgi:hypothetical protein